MHPAFKFTCAIRTNLAKSSPDEISKEFRTSKLVRKFLYIVACIIVAILGVGIWAAINPDKAAEYFYQGVEYQTVPEIEFVKQVVLERNKYDDPDMWYARGLSTPDSPASMLPTGAEKPAAPGNAAVFFIHPTSYISKDSWNAELGNTEAESRARVFLSGLASPFASAGPVWAPKYRQATVGAFLTKKPEGQMALNAAYEDILQAFDTFMKENPKRPIILAGHSQGARHLAYLLKDRVAGKAVAKQIAAAYIIGWPISEQSDLPVLGLPLCGAPAQTGCIITFQSYAEPADYSRIINAYSSTTGFNGAPRKNTKILCTNPLNGGAAAEAVAQENLGTLKPSKDLTSGELIPKTVPARCNEDGFILIGDPPNIGPYVLPGNNFHVYDIPLFWANLRADAIKRTQILNGA